MSEDLVIQSHAGPYAVEFRDALPAELKDLVAGDAHILIDANVARLYSAQLRFALERENTIVIEGNEESKTLQSVIPIIEQLVSNRVRRDHTLVAIGGGIIQDITCFIASTLLRGLPWLFVPTTLLAQADSCIGSKSSINLGRLKNILGTFNPPRRILIHSQFLTTLSPEELHSGVGEIIKVHAIEGKPAFDRLAADFDRLFSDWAVLLEYIRAALRIKQPYIERDEFDRGVRNIFNYGHSFGHAIESATQFAIPHGVAVTIGMAMANYVATSRGWLPVEQRERMGPVLRKNYAGHATIPIPVEALLLALKKDKKNTSSGLRLVLPIGPEATIQMTSVVPDAAFEQQCKRFLEELSG